MPPIVLSGRRGVKAETVPPQGGRDSFYSLPPKNILLKLLQVNSIGVLLNRGQQKSHKILNKRPLDWARRIKMAWNTLKYACGHTEEVQLYGKHTERERTIANAATHDCPTCRAEAAKAKDAESGLPALRGSDKQIAWASQIRAETMATKAAFMATMEMIQAKLDAVDYPSDTPAEKVEAARAEIKRNRTLVERLDAIDKASWWIDHRGNSYKYLIAVLIKEAA